LKATGILDAYQHVMDSLIQNGWPQEKSVFDHAAYELLKWHSEHKEDLTHRDVKGASENYFATVH
jgi:hypothetical protein